MNRTGRLSTWALALLMVLVSVVPAPPAAAMRDGTVEGYWCDVYLVIRRTNGIITGMWFEYENCEYVGAGEAGPSPNGDVASLDGSLFDGCESTCASPCTDYAASCHSSCGSIVGCQSCCAEWKRRADSVDQCRLACRLINLRLEDMCSTDCIVYYNN